MTQDLALAVVHHWALLLLIAALFAEFVLLRQPPSADWVRTLARVDQAYGGAAVLLLAAGFARVAWGAKGADFYLQNPVFWAKVAVFVLVGLLSIVPTARYPRWLKQLKTSGQLPTEAQVDDTRRWVGWQLVLFVALPVLAAMMARGIGL
jgi:putative membrane protein